jgi:hypothetical protein
MTNLKPQSVNFILTNFLPLSFPVSSPPLSLFFYKTHAFHEDSEKEHFFPIFSQKTSSQREEPFSFNSGFSSFISSIAYLGN